MEEVNIYEIMYEVVEDENFELRKQVEELQTQNDILAGYAGFLEHKNKELISDYNSLFNIKLRNN